MTTIGGIDLVGGTIAAFGALLVYDVFFVTFEQEVVTLVWPSRWNLGKILFFLNRYLPFADTFLSLHLLLGNGNTDQECLLGFRAVTWLIVIGLIISEMILTMRTYAMWGSTRFILIILTVLGLGLFIPAIVITQIEVSSFVYESQFTGCSKTKNSSPIIFVAFLLLIIWETSIVTMTMLVVRRDHLLTICLIVDRRMRSALVQQMYKDGVLYYLYQFAFTIVNLLIAVAAPPDFANWLTTPQRVFHSILCTRVLLHIRAHNTTSDSQFQTTRTNLSFAVSPDAEQKQFELSSESWTGAGLGSGVDAGSAGSAVLTSSHSQSQSQSHISSSIARDNIEEYSIGVGLEGNGEAFELRTLSRSPPQVQFEAQYMEGGSPSGNDEKSALSATGSPVYADKKGKVKERREKK
ncbi:hypothetical protein EW145_g1647 [Phellinidium pouzarii]|uniref:DUF6533 domain-containing protein n=1 Tax=Phellinidium pouzarii TaxID=167371 RepID=A0A4S4LFF6_9AGAM|nr:hypothetical protein EW145_g1647 [Phellinidium pouzarii]